MIVIACLDDNGGMMFNHRRQSQDRMLRAHIAALVGDARLWMNHYSAQQFDAESIQHLNVDDAFLQEAVDGDYCFVEDAALTPFERWIEKIIIFRWHRTYPADQHFDIDLSGGNWKICESVEFTGHSHERITIVEHLRDYSIDYIRTRCLDVINNQYKTVSQQARENGLSVSLF